MNIRGRGSTVRGSSTKKTNLLPNLSVAGKREVKADQSTSKSGNAEKRGRGGRRGARGSGRGGREARKPTFIEQAGIFSSGLNDDGRHDRPKTQDEYFPVTNSRLRKRENADIEMTEAIDSKPVTYETEWVSDEEGDLAELTELLKDEFISDLKLGDVKPLVLPLSDETQFDRLMQPKVKKEETLDPMEVSFPDDLSDPKKETTKLSDQKPEKIAAGGDQLLTELDPTSVSSQQASVLLKNVTEAEDDSFLLWQLPSTLSVLAGTSKEDDSGTEQSQKQEKKAESRHCLNELPSGAELGRLRIRRSGRVELVVGGMLPLDVTCAVPTHYRESVVMVELEQQKTDGFGQIQSFKSEFGDRKNYGNEIYVLGNLEHALVCSHDFPHSIGLKRKNVSATVSEKKVLEKKDDDVKALLLELKKLEKKEEGWKDWDREYDNLKSDNMEND